MGGSENSMELQDIKSYTLEELQAVFIQRDLPKYRALQVY